MRALHHIATMAPREALAPHRALLLHAAMRTVTAADTRVWPAAAPAMCRLVVALEGKWWLTVYAFWFGHACWVQWYR